MNSTMIGIKLLPGSRHLALLIAVMQFFFVLPASAKEPSERYESAVDFAPLPDRPAESSSSAPPENGENGSSSASPTESEAPDNPRDPRVDPESVDSSVENQKAGAGIGGRVIRSDDPDATRATEELEGASLKPTKNVDVPERFPRSLRIGWWTLFGGVALATVGGSFATTAESRAEEARRIAARLDPATGRTVEFSDVQTDYEKAIRQGQAFERSAQVLLTTGALAIAAGVTFLSIYWVQQKKKKQHARVQALPGTVGFRF